MRGEVCGVGADFVLLTFPAQMRSPTTSFADKNSVQRLAGDVLPNQAHVTAFNVQVGDGRQHGRAANAAIPTFMQSLKQSSNVQHAALLVVTIAHPNLLLHDS